MYRKFFLFLILIFIVINNIFADSFTDAIQELAEFTSCVYKYDATKLGENIKGTNKYKEDRFSNRLVKEYKDINSNHAGVCFDYARFAYEYVIKNKIYYNLIGMYERQIWIAGNLNISNEIYLEYPVAKSNIVINNEHPIKIPEKGGINYIEAHYGATNHAWIWILRADGVWFWIDPTWSDEYGYIFYGYVDNKNGEEIQCRPDEKYCINYPAILNTLPLPPEMGNKLSPSKTADSDDPEVTIQDARLDWTDVVAEKFSETIDKTFINVHYNMNDSYLAVVFSANVPYEKIRDKNINMDTIGFGIDFQFAFDTIAMINGIEYLRNKEDGNNLHGILFDFNYERRLFNNLAWYIGGDVGLRGDFSNKENIYAPKIYEKNSLVALKAETGFVVNISVLCAKVEISFDNILGVNVGVGIGFGMEI